MKFSIGEKVGFLYEKGGGTILRLDEQNRYVVLDETGFDRPFLDSEIVKIHGTEYKMDHYSDVLNDDETHSEAKFTVHKEKLEGNSKATDMWEIDLHIESLLDSHRNLTNTEILMRQMTEFRSFFKRAQEKNIQKIVVIHGVGEGVLKNEIRMFLAKKENIEFYDASFHDYGKGATEIRMFLSKNQYNR